MLEAGLVEVDSCLGRVCPRSFSTRTVGVVGGSRRTTNHTPRIGTLHHLVTGYLFEEFMILIRRIYDGGEGLPLREGGPEEKERKKEEGEEREKGKRRGRGWHVWYRGWLLELYCEKCSKI